MMRTLPIIIILLFVHEAAGQLTDSGARVGRWDLMYYGAKCDGTTDDTAALNNAIAFVIAAGGTLYLPQGQTCRINGQVAIPNNGDVTKSLQNGLRITGSGAGSDAVSPSHGSASGSGGSTLDMRYSSGSSTDGKILTTGVGKLEIDHVMLKDGGSDTTPFVYTTNTALMFHHNTVYGTGAGQDVIVLGGTTTTIGPAQNAAFQGYGTVIDSNFVDKISRFVYFRTFANGVQVTNNTVWNLSAGVAPIELDGSGGGQADGNVIAHNLFELIGYQYAAKLTSANNNLFIGNTNWDHSTPFVAFFDCIASHNNLLTVGEPTGVSYASYTTGNTAGDNVIMDGVGMRNIGSGAECVNTNNDLGKIWFDTTTNTTAMKVCMFVSGSLQWVTK